MRYDEPAEACVDWSDHHTLVNEGERDIASV